MIPIFAALAIVSVFEVLPSKAGPIDNVIPSQINDVQPKLKPEEILTQMATIVNETPEIIYALTDLEPEKVAQMVPHLKEVTRILKGNPLGELFEYMDNLCAHHQELQQIKNVTEHIQQFVDQSAGQAPITIKNKTKIKLVYAPRYDSQYGSRSKDESTNDELAKEVGANKMRIAQEAAQDLQKIRNNAKAAQDQLAQQVVQGNEALQKQLRDAQDATKKGLTDAINLMESEKQRAYDDMKKAINWLHQQMEQQMGVLNTELEEKKKYYQTNVESLASSIRQNLDRENGEIEKQVSQATENLQQRLTNANTQLGTQLAQYRTMMEDEVKKAANDIEAQVKDIREKMRAAMEGLKKDMQNVDAELKQSVTNAYNGAKKSAMSTTSQAEVEKTIAEMKKATQEMREQMENEIRSAIQALSMEIKSILTDMRNAKNMVETIPATPPSNVIQDTVGQAAGSLAQGSMSVINKNNNNNGSVGKETKPSNGLDSQLHGLADEVDSGDLEFDDFEDDGDYTF